MVYPLRFFPIYKDYLWGGRNLEKLGRKLPEGIIAESWEISAHPDGVGIIANGEFAGTTLPEFITKFGGSVVGTGLNPSYLRKFPLLVKLIDANQQLSVQVHPDNAYAQTHENEEYGKTEMWYIISAKPGSQIIYNLKPGIDRQTFAQSVNKGEIKTCLNYLDVTAGDVITIPAGCIHALGGGLVLAEIQQNSNATYRVYDYDRVDAQGRKRPLHIDKALEVIKFDAPEVPIKHVDSNQDSPVTLLTATPFFTVELCRVNGILPQNTERQRFYLYTFIKGEALIDYPGGTLKINVPESVMIPAALGAYHLEGNFEALKSSMPL